MKRVVIVGGGPAGLMAAEMLSAAGCAVTVHDRMPSLGRKLLMAGRGGLNLTHSEPYDRFLTRYGEGADWLRPFIDAFTPADLMSWAEELGQTTFVGTSGRVFPKAMKASPLLRAWLGRLNAQGVTFRLRSRWVGWNAANELVFEEPDGAYVMPADAVILTTGGGSWPKLGSDGQALGLINARGAGTKPFEASNVGVAIPWSEAFISRFAGQPLKACRFSVGDQSVRGEAVITRGGLEGGAIYALGPAIRQQLAATGAVSLVLDLKPDLSAAQLATRIAAQPASQSLSNRLRKGAKLEPVAVNLLREAHGALPSDAEALATLIKAAPLRIGAMQAIDRAISSAGGVTQESLDNHLMLKAIPGVFCAGELLDWDAPTGGYLLQASFATGRAAASGVLNWLGV